MWVKAAASNGNILTCSRREMRRLAKASISILLLLMLASNASADAVRPTNASTELTLAPGVSSFVYLDGPWQFHVGDDPRWSSPNYDDSGWPSLDLRPAPGAHDPDVGLTHWVPGWSASGYSRYAGYAWYRLRIALSADPHEQLEMLGPALVDGAYQLYVDGTLLGGTVNFQQPAPRAYGIRPRVFVLPSSFESRSSQAPRTMSVALRVWTGPWAIADPQGGGIHIAPVLGNDTGIRAEYHSQWLEKIRGDFFEVGQAVVFVCLAVMACSLIPFDRSSRAYAWLGVALVLNACARGNLMVYWLEGGESVQAFEMFSIVLFVPLTLAAWTVAWGMWLGIAEDRWFGRVVAILSAVYVSAEFLTRSWFYGVLPTWVGTSMRLTITWDRYAFVALWAYVVYRAIRHEERAAWIALPAILLIAIAQFGSELSSVGVPGIWFPFGTGVSLSNYANFFSTFALFGMLLHRLWSFAARDVLQLQTTDTGAA